MPNAIRPSFSEYSEWARCNLAANFDKFESLLYATNVQAIATAAKEQAFFRDLPSILEDLGRSFLRDTGARLFAQSDAELSLKTKPFGSALEKSFRANVIRNKRFPDAPDSGWVTPEHWYTKLNDLVRGTLVCSYVDALPWLANRLKLEAASRGLEIVFNPEVRDEGYYAFHVYARLPRIVLQTRQGEAEVEGALVEIQLTTQLQDALREVTHFHYERRRLDGLPPDWKWQHDRPQFRASYISHALHLVDALIVELRTQVNVARRVDGQPPPPPSVGHQAEPLEGTKK
jgi:hypothetical protein